MITADMSAKELSKMRYCGHMYRADYEKRLAALIDETAQGYYKHLAGKLKSREIDLVIVVNMFLTGFDATTLNTLWVDKNLRLHGLLQAYSRTNRILNSVKAYGNIVSFRDLEQATNDAAKDKINCQAPINIV